MTTEPKYDEDVVNLGYLKKIVADPDGNLENIYENVSKHYASKPQPPYHKGDTWIDGDIIYTCINDREIGTYQDSDWTTESGAREEAERKNKVFLRQPSNYSVGDMWILQSDEDHKAGKKGEILISTAGRKEYDEGDWVSMLGYGTIRSINEVADNLNDAIERIGVTEEAIADGIIITFYQDTMPEAKHIGDLWYVTETVDEFIKGKLYRYNGTEWEILNDPEITKAFEEANEARIVADGKIQSFYSETEPTENVGVGDLWIDLDDNNKLYRYNGTKWIPVYDTRIDTVVVELETVTERTVKIETDLGKITQEVKEVETTVQTVKSTAEETKTQVVETKERVGALEIDVDNITQSVSTAETKIEQVQEQTNLNTDEIARLGSTETVEGEELTVNASNNPAKLYVYGKTEQQTRSGKNKFKLPESETKNGITYTKNADGTFNLSGTSTSTNTYFLVYEKINKLNIISGNNYRLTSNKALNGVSLRAEAYTDTTWLAYCIGLGSGYTNASYAVTIPEGTTRMRYIIEITNNDTTVDYSNIELQLEEGTSKTEFEPYGTMPSIDYPSDIRNLGDNVNLFDKDNANILSAYINGSSKLITNSNNHKSLYIPCEKNKNYTISKEVGTAFVVGTTTNLPTYKLICNSITNNASATSITIKTTANDNYIVIYFYKNETDTLSEEEMLKSIKIEESSIATSYSKHDCGNIRFKVENKNKLELTCETTTKNGVTITNNGDGSITLNGTATASMSYNLNGLTTPTNRYFSLEQNNYYTTCLKNSIKGLVMTIRTATVSTAITSIGAGNDIKSILYKNETEKDAVAYLYISNGTVFDNLTVFPMIVKGQFTLETIGVYQKHEEQTVLFPLSEGQLLHQGDYLAEDGIHQTRNTVIVDGTEKSWQYYSANAEYARPYFTKSGKKIGENDSIANVLANKFKNISWNEGRNVTYKGYGVFSYSGDNRISFLIPKSDLSALTTEAVKEYFAQNPTSVEYNLAEEIIIPYTPEQQKVLDSIETFKGINHIYCIDEIIPEKMILEYYPNTPYNNTLVNKDTFDKVTTEMNAEFNIRANEVETSVKEQTTASILTLLNNGYLTAEQVNALVNGNAEDIATVKEQLTQTVTSSQMQIEITKAIEGGVSYLKNTLFTIDEKGMAIATKQDEFSALYTNRGMELYSYDEMIAKFDVNGTTVRGNLNLDGELVTPNLRMMNVVENGKKRVHIHWIGG